MKQIILLFFLYFFSLNTLYSFDIKNLGDINSYVIDKVGVLNNEEKTEIEQKIIDLKNKYTTEILTIIIKTTEGEDISSIGTQIGHELGVGKADKDNGVVILIAIDDRAWNISTGYGVEGVLPDILTNKIGENNFILFRESKYKDGIIGALNDFDKAFSGDTSIISKEKENNENNFLILIFIAFLGGSFLIKPLYNKKEYKKIFLYLLIGYIITLPIAYFLIKTIDFIIINAISWGVGVMLGIGGKLGNGGSFGGGKSGSSRRGGFGGGGFGGGGSSGRW